ncbi:DEAD/DEAH box helicase [Nocardia brasiliensis]|uniref:DEAD/DEAH box helicase n=1 Tax=Nocardia brasiliensis TaxID=37326 RepID=UPI0024553BC8|nr:DEAD/DEAH box helicase family protein [Nocardia brasiliensis]
MSWSTTDVWSTQKRIGGNSVRQLLVDGRGDLQVDTCADGTLMVRSAYGIWPARQDANVAADEPLTAILLAPDTTTTSIRWSGSHDQISPETVLTSFDGAIEFRAPGCSGSLRRPQIAALHSIVGHQYSGLTEPGVVVMPTGTGKTETMLAWLVAQRPKRVLVVVPSRALRDQIAVKFETLGILHREGIVSPAALRPCVGRLQHRFADADEARRFAAACNVVVATPHVIQANTDAIRDVFCAEFTHLLIDEAHHAPATMWTAIIRAFGERPILLFTATPFRRDGRALPGRIIFRFPLREAQKEEYFSTIDFTAVPETGEGDQSLAVVALERLRSDLAAGMHHILLARVEDKKRAEEIHALYQRLAPEFAPRILHDSVPMRQRQQALEAIDTQTSRVIVCIDMLGEGFDLPTLKVGAFHDAHRSLTPMIQLIGRLARTASPVPIGTASVYVRQDARDALSPLRFLLREDPDWNTILSDITERATQRADEISAFDASFVDAPPDVPVGLLEPKMSAIAFTTTTTDWAPLAAHGVYGEKILDNLICTSADGDVAWFVVETAEKLRWGDVPLLWKSDYVLIVMYFDRAHSFLYVHCSDTKWKFEDLAREVLGHEPMPVNGYDTFRVFADLDRVIPTNVGLLDARDRDKRFTMLVGSNVESGLTEAERAHKANTHIDVKAFHNGDSVTVAAALSGRFWSKRAAPNLADWCSWCKAQGAKLADTAVNVHSLFRDMIIPVDVKERPPYPLLAMEWPWEFYCSSTVPYLVGEDDSRVLLTDAEFRVDDHGDSGPLRFSVITQAWQSAYEADFGATGLHYRAAGPTDVHVERRRSDTVPLALWLNDHKPTLFFSGDRMITADDRLLAPQTELAPYPREELRPIDFIKAGVDITVESQRAERKPNSIQAFMASYLLQSQSFDVLVDDDRAGEAADLVGVRIDHGDLLITLVHCKYSAAAKPGHRLEDLYEVCGQAMRGARWRDKGALPLLEHLDHRVRGYARNTNGGTAFEIGDLAALFKIRQRAPQLFPRLTTLIVQPGLSIAESTDEQLRLIAGAASYVQTVTKGAFHVYCSA